MQNLQTAPDGAEPRDKSVGRGGSPNPGQLAYRLQISCHSNTEGHCSVMSMRSNENCRPLAGRALESLGRTEVPPFFSSSQESRWWADMTSNGYITESDKPAPKESHPGCI